MTHPDFAQYVGVPWEAGAAGPDSYDCMAFFAHIQGTYFGRDVPRVLVPDYDNARTLVSLFANHQERANWQVADTPVHGCAVLSRSPLHIGTWLDVDGGGVLHCVRGIGVIFTHNSSWLHSGFGRREYYTHI